MVDCLSDRLPANWRRGTLSLRAVRRGTVAVCLALAASCAVGVSDAADEESGGTVSAGKSANLAAILSRFWRIGGTSA